MRLGIGGLIRAEGVLTLLCATFALVGLQPAVLAVPFITGALVGDGLFCLAIRDTPYQESLVIVAILTVVSGLILSFDLWAAWLLPGILEVPWDVPAVVERLAFGVTLGFGGLILTTVVFPGPFSSQTWEEAVEDRRELVRGATILAGVLVALLVIVSLLAGFLALVAYFAARFAG